MKRDSILRIYIDQGVTTGPRRWWRLGSRKKLNRFLFEKAIAANIGQVELRQANGGYVSPAEGSSREHEAKIPDCLEIIGHSEELRLFLDIYRSAIERNNEGKLSSEQNPAMPHWILVRGQ
jgi:hypothetical protein